LAFVLVAIACMLILANAVRSEAVHGYLEDGAHRVVAGVELALEHQSAAQPIVAPPAASAPFDRVDVAAAPGRPIPAPSAPTASASVPLQAAPTLPPVASMPSVQGHETPAATAAGLARATRPHTVHRTPHAVHRATHPGTHRAARRITHRVVQRSTSAVTSVGVRGHRRALDLSAHPGRVAHAGNGPHAPHRTAHHAPHHSKHHDIPQGQHRARR
jgi:hypothetical protein